MKLHNIKRVSETATLNTIYMQHCIMQSLTLRGEVLGLQELRRESNLQNFCSFSWFESSDNFFFFW